MKIFTIKKNHEFLRVYKRGRLAKADIMILYILKNRKKENRFGISVSRKFGKSVKRNRVKRLIKESYRIYSDQMQTGHDLVFVVRNIKRDNLPDFSTVKKEVFYLIKKIGILKLSQE